MQQLTLSVARRSAQRADFAVAVQNLLSGPKKIFETRLRPMGEADTIERGSQPVVGLLLIALRLASIAFGRKNGFSYVQYLLAPRQPAFEVCQCDVVAK
ncbi:hypothetical protein BjapCC829_07635 [Bradyrhizobium barranii]|uniref:Uncharacterized protein n=1 Tax=Bradyrhizobium barranii TaxID=2992140 RepID=A0ABY3QRA3_9BRAD|nr:hypothetical protein [Bradyrhizobium japonicum]UFW88402.1 hypothetical protein BjapCC829_07635 [Bradyrhizobium japonicum]